jgi:hypothetical protein
MSLLTRLDRRDELTDPGDIAKAGAAILLDRRAALRSRGSSRPTG